MNEPTGPQLAARLRALLPSDRQASYDDNLESVSYQVNGEAGRTNSACGALMALTGPFRECLDEGDFATAGRLVDEMERLLGEFPDPTGLDGSIANSVLACFLESVLPVDRAAHDAIRPHIGPLIESHAKRFDPWWLRPEPPGPRETLRSAD